MAGIEDDVHGRPGAPERDEGEFVIEEVLDCTGEPVNNAVEIRLQTLPRDEGFWLDTGVIYS